MEKSFTKREEIYKIVKYQTKLLNSKTQQQQDLYRYKLNDHINNLSQFGLTKEMKHNIMNGGELDISNMDAILGKINTQRDETLDALNALNATGSRVESEFGNDSKTIMSTIESIKSRLDDVNKRLSETDAELRRCREDVSKGDNTSKDAIGKLTDEKNKLQSERDSLMNALEQAMNSQATVRDAAVAIKDKAAVPNTLSLKEISKKLTELMDNFNPLVKVDLGKSGIERITASDSEKNTSESVSLSVSEPAPTQIPVANNAEKKPKKVKRQ
jgi:hypothetical protein